VLNYLKYSLPQQIPGLNLVYCQDGYFGADQLQTIIDNIHAQNAQLVLVAMGVPKQEYFIEKAQLGTNHAVFIGVGGSFDVWADKKLRAPKVWQDYQVEWLYRLISEPWRFERMANTLPIFACQVIFNQIKMWLTNEQK
jgi:exopolysaccharide biosynthesis WecB/TagA/CpsF family protein